MRIEFFHSFTLRTLFFITLIFSVISTFPGCAATDNSCSQLLYNCGSLKGIGYPFWGDDRPQSCGIRPLQLQCQEDQTVLVNGDLFIVLRIEEHFSRMTVVHYDLWKDICPKKFANTSWINSGLFNTTLLHKNSSDLIIFYGCSSEAVTSVAQVQNNVTCSTDGVKGSVAFAANNGNVSLIQGCTISIVVPVNIRAYNELWDGKITLNEAVNQGFTVEYKDLEIACQNNSQIPYCPTLTSPGRNKALKLATGISAAGIGMLICLLICFCKFKKSSSQFFLLSSKRKGNDDKNIDALIEQFGFLAPKRYRYSDIKRITNSFKDKLGSGGYGDVYKGNLSDGFPVAVKILNVSKGDGEDFVNEVASISRTSHVNIVNLLGFCIEERKRALIYEFMPNGSLEKFIHGENMQRTNCHLGWEKLYQIALGVARGLEYLHRGCSTRILHLDIKPHNILLDEDFLPKISDFGLAKLCTRKESVVSMLGVRGTIGYIAPEIISRNFGGVSHKSDVYSYGMMILEMVGGRKNISVEVSHASEIYFPHWVYHHLVVGEDLKLQGVESQEANEIARKMIIVGLWCIQTDPLHRPAIAKVIEMLDGNLQALEMPPKPFFGSPSRSAADCSTTMALS